MNNALKKYDVQGWVLLSEDGYREGMKTERIYALSPEDAAKHYARSHGIPTKLWNNGEASPPVVIRVLRNEGPKKATL